MSTKFLDDVEVSSPAVLTLGVLPVLPSAGADKLLGWDNTDGAVKYITLGSGLTYTHSTHTLSASGGGSGTVTSIDVTAPAAGITASGGPVTTSGAITLALANDLAAVEGLSGAGVAVRTTTDTWTVRTITGTSGTITVSNGDGVSGNPTLTISGTYAGQSSIVTVGTITAGTWTGTAIAIAYGGTGQTTANDALNALLPSQGGNSGKVLSTDGTDTSWIAASGTGTVTSVALTAPAELSVGGSPVTTSGTLALSWATAAQHAVLAGPTTGGGTPTFRSLALSDLPAGTGTVTSVDLTVPGELGVTGNPVTTSGTLAVAWNPAAAFTVLAGPSVGPGGAPPTFRSLVAADLPAGTGTVTSVDGSGGTTGLTLTGGAVTTTGTLTIGGTLNVASGGTGLSTYTTGDLLYTSATNILSKLGIGSGDNVLGVTAGIPAWKDAPYTPTTSSDWNTVPTTVKQALDLCAALLKVLNGGTGP